MAIIYTINVNDCIKCEDERIVEIVSLNLSFFRKNTDEDSFLSHAKDSMQRLAIKYPSSFITLFFNLTNDERSKIIAEKTYKQYIDKDMYPYEILKKLREEKIEDRGCMNNKIQFPKLNGFIDYIEVTNGYVSKVVHSSNNYFRDDPDFYHMLLGKLRKLIETNLNDFISLYEEIKDDEICLGIANKVINCNIKMHEDIINKLKELL